MSFMKSHSTNCICVVEPAKLPVLELRVPVVTVAEPLCAKYSCAQVPLESHPRDNVGHTSQKSYALDEL